MNLRLKHGAWLKSGDFEIIDARPGGLRLYALSIFVAFGLGISSWALVDNAAGGTDIEVPNLKVPSVEGLTVEQAQRRLENLGFVVDVKFQPNEQVSKGRAFDQDPLGGARLDQGDPVAVVFSDGPLGLTVPSVIGQQETEAVNVLFRNTLVAKVVKVYDDSIRPGEVVGTEPEIGERVQRGGTVELQVSQGPRPRIVPEMVDKPLVEGLIELGRAGLVIGDIDRPYVSDKVPGTILETIPAAGTELPRNMPVGLVVAGNPETTMVPFFVGLRSSSALLVAAEADLELIVRTEYVDSEDSSAGRVISQGLPPGTDTAPGSTVEIKVAAVRLAETPVAPTTTQKR